MVACLGLLSLAYARGELLLELHVLPHARQVGTGLSCDLEPRLDARDLVDGRLEGHALVGLDLLDRLSRLVRAQPSRRVAR